MNLFRSPKFLVLVLAALSLAAEAATRIATGRPWSPVSVVDGRLGYRLLPNQEVTGRRGTRVAINSHGFRDREWTERTQGELRIALLGKSITFGSYVAIEETWGRRLESILRAKRQDPVTVMNFAARGYRLEQMARVLEDHVSTYEPELVILPVTADVVWPMSQSLVDDPGPLECWVRRSALHSLIEADMRVFWPADGLWPEGQQPDASELRRRGQALSNQPSSGDPLASEQEHLWTEASDCLERMQCCVATWGGQLLVVALPQLSDGFSEGPSKQMQRWSSLLDGQREVRLFDARPAFMAGMHDLFTELHQRELDVAKMSYRHWVSLADEELEQAETSLVLLHSPTHLSPKGHAVLASAVAEMLNEGGFR